MPDTSATSAGAPSAPAPDAVPGLVRLMVLARNVMRPGPALRLKDELGDAAAMLLMQQQLLLKSLLLRLPH